MNHPGPAPNQKEVQNNSARQLVPKGIGRLTARQITIRFVSLHLAVFFLIYLADGQLHVFAITGPIEIALGAIFAWYMDKTYPVN